MTIIHLRVEISFVHDFLKKALIRRRWRRATCFPAKLCGAKLSHGSGQEPCLLFSVEAKVLHSIKIA